MNLAMDIIGLVLLFAVLVYLLVYFFSLCQQVDEIHAKLFKKDDEPPTDR